MDIRLLGYESTTAAWRNCAEMRDALASNRSGLIPNDLPGSEIPTWIGRVKGLESLDLGSWASRNNALAEWCLTGSPLLDTLECLKTQYGNHRIGLIVGSSTSSIDRTETAYQHLTDTGALSTGYQQPLVHNPHALGLYLAHRLGLNGPNITINTACSSSAKVFASAARWLELGIVDAVLVGGTDALGLSVVHGFHALQLVSPKPCRPFDKHRDGINIGEAAGFALLVKGSHPEAINVALTGFGESSDAHHMSHPHPDGDGAKNAIKRALSQANLSPADIGYINLHGTASQANDRIEGAVIESLFPPTTVCSSTKGFTGHTLGAAGITEAIIALDALISGTIPANLNLQEPEISGNLTLARTAQQKSLDHVLSNSFGFGGNNCSLIFSKTSEGQA